MMNVSRISATVSGWCLLVSIVLALLPLPNMWAQVAAGISLLTFLLSAQGRRSWILMTPFLLVTAALFWLPHLLPGELPPLVRLSLVVFGGIVAIVVLTGITLRLMLHKGNYV